ncbi:probable monosaccharide transporter [Melanopsichium pennsylvanicum]|uniref:Probable monosaccharide transporter n=2 Tax=Melanopsichium pennsylvanicum TaxID=63383 RepID=A0AAJ4XNG6_9BASI|nr:probable monosaccharide transporter [Melanopsichium pennsylvanicum 4]SNX85447.1 probable monosaccharide transporter [Melanopsichium pennsylvanicum]
MQGSPSNSSHEDVLKNEKNDLKIVHAGDVDLNQVQGFEASKPSRMTRKAQILALAICTGGFLFGYDIGVISGCFIMDPFILTFGGTCGPDGCSLPDTRVSLINSSLSIGTFVGALLQAPVSDFFGRKPSMITWASIFTVGAVIQTATISSWHQFAVGRAFAGLGVGALSGLCPLYLGETAPKHIRGAMVTCYQLLIIFGIFISYGISWATQNFKTSDASWKIPVGLQLLWGIVMLSLMFLLPESPRYCLKNGEVTRAREIMAAMRDVQLQPFNGEPRGDKWMEAELAEMKEGIDEENRLFAGHSYLGSYLVCFSTKNQMWKRTINGMMLQTLQQLNGQNFYYYYLPLLSSTLALPLNPFQIQFILGSASLLATVPALIAIEKLGRRPLLLIGAACEAACSFIVAFVGHYKTAPRGTDADLITPAQHQGGSVFIAFAIIHLLFYSCCWGPGPWLYLSESFNSPTRAKAISLGSASNWIWNFLLSYFSNQIAAELGPFIMLIFGGVLCFAFVYVYFMIPETKGISLEDVELLYSQHIQPWKSAVWVRERGLDKNVEDRAIKA